MWDRYCYAKGWCRLKLQINKELAVVAIQTAD